MSGRVLLVCLAAALAMTAATSRAALLPTLRDEPTFGDIAATARLFHNRPFASPSLNSNTIIRCEPIRDRRPFQYSCLGRLTGGDVGSHPAYASVLVSRQEYFGDQIFDHYKISVSKGGRDILRKSNVAEVHMKKSGKTVEFKMRCVQSIGSGDSAGYCVVQALPHVVLVTAASPGNSHEAAVERSETLLAETLLWTLTAAGQ
jgi:hypothetical protein